MKKWLWELYKDTCVKFTTIFFMALFIMVILSKLTEMGVIIWRSVQR